MAECSPFLELNQAQLDVVARVIGPGCPVVQATAEHHAGPVLKYGIVPPDKKPPGIHALYGVEIPEKPGHVGIYLTEVQKEQLQCAGVKPCDYVEVEPIGVKYGIVFPNVMRYAIPVPPVSAPEE